MNEDFLQYVWKYQQWTSQSLTTIDQKPIEVVHPGMQNFDAGPDFLNAKIRIDGTLWAGNVEIHINGSDWYNHKHDKDRAYDNVILHVVFSNDKDVKNYQGEVLPCLELTNLIDYQSYRYYKSWLASPRYIPCETQCHDVPSIIKFSAVQDAAIARIKAKSEKFLDSIRECNGDIEEALYRGLCRSLGLKVNAMPFEQLGRILPLKLIRQNWGNAGDLEALLLGQAGFVGESESGDQYVLDLKQKFHFLKHKYQLEPMPNTAWKFFRLRPPNFPTIRLVQLARIYFNQNALAQKIVENDDLKIIREFFEVEINEGFWLKHYTLDKESEARPKSLGHTTVDVIIINAVVPFLFALSDYNKDDAFRLRGLKYLESMKAEKNSHVRKFADLGFPAQTALDSQGILGLHSIFCSQLKCLNCKVGIQLLRNNV